ncbi:hypothetical protein TOK_1422 [Pseudonocardia sp. N23]|nr:hypothetical protein TOK_1422 [Pseudonocardia sp. N23]
MVRPRRRDADVLGEQPLQAPHTQPAPAATASTRTCSGAVTPDSVIRLSTGHEPA